VTEADIRAAAFNWIRDQSDQSGGAIPRIVLAQGFEFQGQRITVIGPGGIWKPRQFDVAPISITSTPSGPYDDSFTEDGLLVYRYRGSDPNHRDNMGLREAMRTRTPLIYFHGVAAGRYVPVWPVFIIKDDPAGLCCWVAIDPAYALGSDPVQSEQEMEVQSTDSVVGVRRYVAAYTRRRLHQTAFRESVIQAYSSRCSLCSLKHRELLDAAHILSDTHPKGDPIVPNGLCLCKIHHAAFDQNIVGVSPEYRIHVRRDVLDEIDGPMLLHGLQELHQRTLTVPARKRDWPDPERLEIRYKEFRQAG
jgi:putative restriction endonuclease